MPITPQQKQLLLYGAPVVGVFALSAVLRKPAAADTAATGVAAYATPSTDAIGTGQLADFESLITARLQDLSGQVAQGGYWGSVPGVAPPAPPPPPAPPELPPWTPPPAPPPPAPAPPPPPAPAPCPGPPSGWPGLPGEVIVGHLDAPGGGCWYASNYGGVAAVGGAPFQGSAVNYGFGPPNARRCIGIYPNPNAANGYMLVSQAGEQYRFPLGT